jgi:hypothetical protein
VSAVVVPASTEQVNHCNQLAGDAAADELDAENGHSGNGVMSYASALTRLVIQATGCTLPPSKDEGALPRL